MLLPISDEPKNVCSKCKKLWEGDPYEYETDDHQFPCPECAKGILSKNELIDLLDMPYFPGFTGAECSSCHKKLNVHATAGYICTCGSFNPLSIGEIKQLHSNPDWGNSLEEVENAYKNTKKYAKYVSSKKIE